MKHYFIFLIINSSIVGMQIAPKKADRDNIKKLYHCIKHDYTKVLDNLLIKVEFSRTEKVSALLNAIQQRKSNCVAILLHYDVNVNGGNMLNHTPLLEAVLSRQTTVVEWLLIYGADPERRSSLYNFNDIPSVLEYDASDSDQYFITPLALAQARLQSRNATRVDSRICNMLLRPSQSWQDESLKEKVIIITNSCIDAIKHSDNQALIEYLQSCKYTNKLQQNYLNERFKLAAQMGNLQAMRILRKEGAKDDPVFQIAVTAFDRKTIESFLVMQYVDDLQVQQAIKQTHARHHDPHLIPSVNKFNRKKQKTVDLLSDFRKLMIDSVNPQLNITISLQQREITGTK